MVMDLLNLEEQLIFYWKHHSHKVNALIHIANFGPLLPYEPDSLWRLTPFIPNAAFFVVLSYICYYILLEPVAGALGSPLLLYMVYDATSFADSYPNHDNLALIVFVSSLVLQIIGHIFVEKSGPAARENILKGQHSKKEYSHKLRLGMDN
ncbi:23736_t:CDS:2 [Dentiscutata erythropus]|uniref:23736_t:CDS:1 n=1 Tax=Dentiscutata erythropus TaxID=1348616 RepID=A0A9N8ZHJ2_9GLOM|nr:23736_t:CDS:2 [Dentiscutata erythropus]